MIPTWHQDFRGGSGGCLVQIADLGCSRPSVCQRSRPLRSFFESIDLFHSFILSFIHHQLYNRRHMTLLACFDRGKQPNQQLQSFAIIVRNLISPMLRSSKVFLYDFLLLILDQNSTDPVVCIIKALEKTCQGTGLDRKSSAFS